MASNRTLPKGIYTRGDNLWLTFSYKGERCREPLKLKATAANIKYAGNKKILIDNLIHMGGFTYSDHFPESKRALLYGGGQSNKTISELRDNWFAIRSPDLASSTAKEYKKKSNKIVSCMGDSLATSLKRSDIEHFLAVDCSKLANKTKNEYLVILRGMFKLAMDDGLISTNPLSGVENRKVIKPEPDPFTKEEIQLICLSPTDRPMERAMIQFGIWTGLRSSELIAVGWDDLDIDWAAQKGYLHVKRARVDGEYKTPKTGGSRRRVELLQGAIDALRQIRLLTQAHPPVNINVRQDDNRTKLSEEWRPIFRSSHHGKPHHDDQYRDSWWKQHLRKAGVRYRPSNNVRHTYASQLLSTGMISKDWIAMQMGHSTTKMIEERYAKWIPEDTPSMANLVNNALGFATKTSHQKQTAS